MRFTVKDVLQFVEENDIKFVRLVFFDIFGIKKNISVMSQELETVFEYGASIVPSHIGGFEGVTTELLLFPDPSTLKILPWRPQHGRVARLLCDIKNPDGTDFESDVRGILKKAVEQSEQTGFVSKVGVECEFYLLKLDENGEPTRIPHDNAGYLDVAPLDKGENVRRQICLTLEQMEIDPLSSHHENGPGQNEIDFKHSEPLNAADDFETFKDTVKASAASNGLFASFMPKPLADQSGSGMYINLMLRKYGFSIFKDSGEGLSETAKNFIAGLQTHLHEIALFLNPLPNSYERIRSCKMLDVSNSSYTDSTSLIRLSDTLTNHAKLQLRLPDPSCNPYLAFALIIYAGLDGIENHMEFDGVPKVPLSFDEAVACAENSAFLKKCLPAAVYDAFISEKKKMADCQEELMEKRYFEII